MSKLNCWEYFKCGREEGGAKVATLGVCPASTEKRADGLNGGQNGGRACWALAQTLCAGMLQGDVVSKMAKCMNCEFKKLVLHEEKLDFVNTKTILKAMGDPVPTNLKA